MGRSKLTDEQRRKNKQKRYEQKKDIQRLKKENGICRDCEEKVCKDSTVFCENHLKRHRKYCFKASKKHYKNGGKHYQIQNRAKARNIEVCNENEFNIWLENQKRSCHYCGIEEFQLSSNNDKKQKMLTIDRKNNAVGYVPNNMCLACFRCNNSKSNFFKESEWKEICEKFVKPRLHEYHKIE